jgi:AcrR family transcriptional regulator
MSRSSTARRVLKRPVRKRRRLIRLDNDERRAQLLAMGRAAFTQFSYDEVSIDELAKKAKISKGLFYYYFPTKRDLYIAGLKDTAKELVDKLTGVKLQDTSPRERANVGVDAYLEHVASQSQGFIALMRGGIGSDPEVHAVLEGVRTAIVDEFLRGAPISQFLRSRPLSRIAIRSWVGMVESASIEWLSSKDVTKEAVRDLLVDALFDMLTRVLDPRDAERLRPA